MGTPTLYRSTDTSAPTLSGTAGDLITVLDACLVNGYGSQSAAGWTKSFSGTNKAVYRPPAGSQLYVRIVDDGTVPTEGAKVATLEGYETMSNVDTGTGAFGAFYAAKSISADATTREWFVLADNKRFVFGASYTNTYANAYNHVIFGDLIGHAAADTYPCVIFGCSSSANAVHSTVGASTGRGNAAYTQTTTGWTIAREVGGTGGAVAQLVMTPISTTSGNGAFDAGPDASGRVYFAPLVQLTGTTSSSCSPRGYIPGVAYVWHNLTVGVAPAWTAYGDYRILRYNTDANCYALHVGTWD